MEKNEYTLDAAWRCIWTCLEAGAGPHRSPFTMMQAATSGLDGAPQVRTIVLRAADEASGALAFHTDLRSPKIAQLRRDPRIALVVHDLANHLQIRLDGEATIHADGAARAAIWAGSRPHTLILYQAPFAPGTPVESPPAARVAPSAQAASREAGFEHFALIEVRLTRIDFLDISPNGHTRVAFSRERDVDGDGNAWRGQWVAP